MRIVVLGRTGMLGHKLVEHLSTSQHEIISFDRQSFDASKDDFDKIPSCDWLINCIGSIKQNAPSAEELDLVNAKFPLKLAQSVRNTKILHVSTDCVFSGKKGYYVESDEPDADDDYGLSKFRGEPSNAMVIRTSLIGREIRGKRSLLEWCLAQRDAVQGYSNHRWNGLTTLEFSKCVQKIIDEDLYEHGVHHVFSTPVTKHEMLEAFNKKFELQLKVSKVEAKEAIDRTLSTEKSLCSVLDVLSFEEMIRRLR